MKKEGVKKQVKFKDPNPLKKKPKVKNTEVKRKARIINTNPNIKGPKAKAVKVTKVANNKTETKPTPDLASSEPPQLTVQPIVPKSTPQAAKTQNQAPKAQVSAPKAPKSPEKAVPKPPEIIDLEAQLEALSKSVDLSKNESKNFGFSNPSSPSQKKVSTPSRPDIKTTSNTKSPLTDIKLPSSVRVTKVEGQSKNGKNNSENTSKAV